MIEYITQDTRLATYLCCLSDVAFVGSECRDSTVKFKFHFKSVPEMNRLVADYNEGRALVDPLAYSNKREKLMRIIHEMRD